eukprot:4724558-Amphidinium_carterae.1
MTGRRSTAQKAGARPSAQHQPHTKPSAAHQDGPARIHQTSAQLTPFSAVANLGGRPVRAMPVQSRCCWRHSSI